MLAQYLNLPRSVYLLCLGTLINRAGTFIVPFLALYMKDSMGVSETFAAMAMGAFGAGAAVAMVVGGFLADRIGRRPVIVIAMFGGAAVLILMSRVHDPELFLGCVFLLSLVADMYRPAVSAMLSDLVPPQDRPRAYSLMYISINLGFAIGPALAGFIAERASFAWLFWGDAATTAIYGLIVMLAIGETRPVVDRKAREANGAAGGAEPGVLASVLLILRDRVFIRFCLACMLVALVFTQMLSSFPLYAGSLGVSKQSFGLIIALNGAMIVALQMPMSVWLVRFDRAKVLVVSAVLHAIGFGMFGLVSSEWAFAAAVAVWTIGEICQVPTLMPIVADLAPVHMRARYMGAFALSFALAQMIGGPLGGWTLEHLGGQVLWAGTFVVGLASAGLYGSLRPALSRLTLTPTPNPNPPAPPPDPAEAPSTP